MKIIKENLKENFKKFEICNIPKWWKRGYTGKNIKIAEIEPARPDLYIFDGKLHDPVGYGENTKLNSHGQKVLDVMHQIAPDAELYTLPTGFYTENGKAKGRFVEITIPYLIKNKIHFCCASLGGISHDDYNNYILNAQKNGTTFVASAGNLSEKGLDAYAKSNIWISIGAAGYNSKKDEIVRANYSSVGEELDFMSFSGLYVHDAKNQNRVFPQSGTSFSQPMFSAMCALVQQFFLEQAGRTLYQNELYKFCQDNSLDLGDKGRDVQYGHGLFVLPNPEDININKYLINKPINELKNNNLNEKSKEETNMGEKVIHMDTPARIINGRFHVIGRPFVEALGGKAIWDKNNPKYGIFELNGKRIILKDGSKEMIIENL